MSSGTDEPPSVNGDLRYNEEMAAQRKNATITAQSKHISEMGAKIAGLEGQEGCSPYSYCPLCHFTTNASGRQGKCPNDGVQLVRQTWKEVATEAKRLTVTNMRLHEVLEANNIKLRDACKARDVIIFHHARHSYGCPAGGSMGGSCMCEYEKRMAALDDGGKGDGG